MCNRGEDDLSRIVDVRARQILDSRGRPTVEADVLLKSGARGRASVPSGASTGAAEATELRDGSKEYEGFGVLGAVANVNGSIRETLIGMESVDQVGIDHAMRSLDGTENLCRLGANACLAVSLAVLRAAAAVSGMPLHRRIAQLAEVSSPTLPMPMVNILSGGLHASGGMDIQDFLVVPLGAQSFGQALEWVSRVRATAAVLCSEIGKPTLLADEGGLSPGFDRTEAGLEFLLRAIEKSCLRPGEDVAIALDLAASRLLTSAGRYLLPRAGIELQPDQMTSLLKDWVRSFPIISIEDGLGEDDWEHWPSLTAQLGAIQVVGDDLFCTNPERVGMGVTLKAANAVLVKPNQAGDFTRTCATVREARRSNYKTIVSARSGETEDDFIADLSVGLAAGQIKIGSVRNSERLAKYNQLSRLEEEGLPFAGRGALAGNRSVVA